jgi:hypothetical protein
MVIIRKGEASVPAEGNCLDLVLWDDKLAIHAIPGWGCAPLMEDTPANAPLITHCPECGKALDVSGLSPYAKIECPHCAAVIRVRTTIGQYQIVGPLGEGGMSQVFRALDRNLGREVALKILHQSLIRDMALTAMFEREAKLTASIVHPNVVKVFSVAQDHGYFYIAMELLQATSLEQLIAVKGALPEPEVLGIALDVARGLQAAYEENLIHRDIKPGNMLVTGEGMTKLVDFGLALQQGGEDLSEDLWATPFYVPPEKLEGAADTFLGDIYSLGATLYHALAGKPPFDANTSSMEELKTIKKNTIDLKSAAPGLSKATVRLVEKMMAYRPEDRVQSYADLIVQIEEVRRRQFGIQSGIRGRFRKKRLGLGIAGVCLLAGAIAAAAVYLVKARAPTVEGDLGIGGGDRVITAGENTITGRFLGARDRFLRGEFREASEIFTGLAADESVPASTRIWSHFFLGTIRLYNGETQPASESFREVLAITPEADAGNAEAFDFLKRAAALGADELPVLPEGAKFASGGIESLGFLVAALKNWQLGEFESAAVLFKSFAESQPAEPFAWIGGLKGRVEPFLKDFAVLATLPNPAASASDLDAQAEALKKGAAALKTRGAAPRLVKGRIDRIGAIRELASAPPPGDSEPPAEAAVTSPGSAAPPPTATGDSSSPQERAEINRLKALLATFRPLSETLLFSSAVRKLQEESFTSPVGNGIREELVHAYTRAGQYPGLLAAALTAKPFDGVVKRRAGRDLEAKVTSLGADTFVIDLGFGPNEVGIGEFSPQWLVEAGMGALPPLSRESADSWESLVFFGLCCGEDSLATPKAEALAAVDPAFAKRWETLRPLR